jgi:hypothetical protein
MNLEELFHRYKEHSIHGRYITLDSIVPILEKLRQISLKLLGNRF